MNNNLHLLDEDDGMLRQRFLDIYIMLLSHF